MTETAAVGTATLPIEWTSGHVCAPAPSTAIKLADVPVLGYFARDGRGEVCMRGENCMKAYFKEQRTPLDAEGWLHTGDVGEMLPNGNLRIIDRVNSVYKLSQGEFVAPERIESVYARSALVANCYVHGDPTKVLH